MTQSNMQLSNVTAVFVYIFRDDAELYPGKKGDENSEIKSE